MAISIMESDAPDIGLLSKQIVQSLDDCIIAEEKNLDLLLIRFEVGLCAGKLVLPGDLHQQWKGDQFMFDQKNSIVIYLSCLW